MNSTHKSMTQMKNYGNELSVGVKRLCRARPGKDFFVESILISFYDIERMSKDKNLKLLKFN